MPTKIRRTTILIEQHELKTVSIRSEKTTVYCEQCGAIVTALIPNQTEMETLPIGDLEKIDESHFIGDTNSDRQLICSGSIASETNS